MFFRNFTVKVYTYDDESYEAKSNQVQPNPYLYTEKKNQDVPETI